MASASAKQPADDSKHADAASTQKTSEFNSGGARLTPYVMLSCIFASSAGFIYGYEFVIAGGIGIMDDFLAKFYPKVLEQKEDARQDVYCKYKNDAFQLFASSLYLGALFSTFVASFVTRTHGRKASMLTAGLLFIFGTIFGTSAQNLSMLLFGQIFLGLGLGFSNQVVPLYISEIAPAQVRGGLVFFFGLNVTCGILGGNIVNYLTEKVHPWGWRISLGVVGLPSLFFTLCTLFLLETPTWLIQQGHHIKAKQVLVRLRDSNQIDAEYKELSDANNVQNNIGTKSSYKILLTNKRYLPQLVIGMALPFFQQMAGTDALLFYGVFIFKTAGFGNQASLYSTIITGATSCLATLVSLFFVDRIGRRKILIGAGTILLLTMVTLAMIFAIGLNTNISHGKELGKGEGIGQVVVLCVFVAAFGISMGPLIALIPSEIYPLEVCSAGLSLTVFVDMLFKFIISQTFLSMLCTLQYGTFLFFSACMLLAVLFVVFFLPETKGIPLHAMQNLWSSHWFWKIFVHGKQQALETLSHESST